MQTSQTSGRRDTRLLIGLLAGDALFLLLHAVHMGTAWLPGRMYSLEEDLGFSEIYQYLKEIACGCLLLRMARATREPVHGMLAAVLFYLVADDMLRLHETLGAQLVQHLDLVQAMHLRAADIGELLAGLTTAVCLLGAVVFAWWRSGMAARALAVDLCLLLGVLMVFGVFVDALHAALSMLPVAEIFTVIEEGGELATVTVLLWYTRRCAEGLPLPWAHGQRLLDLAGQIRRRVFGRPI